MTDYNADIDWDQELMPWDGIDEYGSQENPFFFGAPWQMVAPRPRESQAFSHVYQGGRLRLTFPSGKTYAYRVSEDLYRQFLAAESKGAFFHRHIRHLNYTIDS
jgi:hypothetical protein